MLQFAPQQAIKQPHQAVSCSPYPRHHHVIRAANDAGDEAPLSASDRHVPVGPERGVVAQAVVT
jgi:hypothetical protein